VAKSPVYLGVSAYWQGDFARAAQVTREGLDIMRNLGDKMGVACALENLGVAMQRSARR
jgi:hypothetical protein